MYTIFKYMSYFRVQNGEENIFPLFRISHYYYSLVGTLVVLIIGLPISWITGKEVNVDEKLITPWMRWAIIKVDSKDHKHYNEITKEELEKLNVHS